MTTFNRSRIDRVNVLAGRSMQTVGLGHHHQDGNIAVELVERRRSRKIIRNGALQAAVNPTKFSMHHHL